MNFIRQIEVGTNSMLGQTITIAARYSLVQGCALPSVLGDLPCTRCGTPWQKLVHPVPELVHPGLKQVHTSLSYLKNPK